MHDSNSGIGINSGMIPIFAGIGIGIGIGIKNNQIKWNRNWNRNQTFELTWNWNRNQNHTWAGIVHHWSKGFRMYYTESPGGHKTVMHVHTIVYLIHTY